MRFACIDIGSNTTRLLVADVEDERLREVAARRHFTQIGASLDPNRRIPALKLAEVAGLAGQLAAQARELGAREVAAVATAAVRLATNGRELANAVQAAAGVPLRVLSGHQEAELSFAGASRAVGGIDGTLAVVDVGGGSTEIAVGTAARGVQWAESIPIGSSVLRERHLCDDPPTSAQIEAAHAAVAAALAHVDPPPVDVAAAVGGTATSLHVLVGSALTRQALESGLARVCGEPAAGAAATFGLPVERVRLMPAGIAVLCGISDLVGPRLKVVAAGLREGVVLQLARDAA